MQAFRKSCLLVILTLMMSALSIGSGAASQAPGRPAPNFLVESGASQKLSLDMIRGKVVVLFYESRQVTKKNLELKNELKRLYRDQPENLRRNIYRLVVIDCSKAIFPATLIWKSKLQEHSKKEGFTIYGDWNRKMLSDYRFKADDSNFLIIDKRGLIRYAAAGKIAPGQFEKIKDMLCRLAGEK
jgi:peroxiredoxin